LRFVESRTGSSEIAISRAWLEPVCGFGSRLAGADDRPGEVCLQEATRGIRNGTEVVVENAWAAVLQVTLLGVITMVDSWVIDRRVPGVRMRRPASRATSAPSPHPDENRSERPAPLAVDRWLGEGAALRVAPELADPRGPLEVGQAKTSSSSARGAGPRRLGARVNHADDVSRSGTCRKMK
jgi:hypothetical protein